MAASGDTGVISVLQKKMGFMGGGLDKYASKELIISLCVLNRIYNSLCGLILLRDPNRQTGTHNYPPLL